MESIGIEVEKPIEVKCDNIGAIFLSENVTTRNRTKHVDIGYRFVNEFVLDNFITIKFVRTLDNKADIFTKNVGGDSHVKHINDMISKIYIEEMK